MHKVEARKRPVNLTLNQDLVRQAKAMTNNLCGAVDRLLTAHRRNRPGSISII